MPGFPATAGPGGSGDRAVRAHRRGQQGLGETATPCAEFPIDQKYTTDGYNKFLDPDGYPGDGAALGHAERDRSEQGRDRAGRFRSANIRNWWRRACGTPARENYGGPLVTAGGLLFIGATTHDRKFHAFDKATGKLLWETLLPAGGNATPATYEVGGKQYVVIAAGGGKSGAPSGGTYVAFALP